MKNSYRGADDKLQIKVGKLTHKQRQTLVLELDDMDVTAMANYKAGKFIFSPHQALAFGNHELRLVEYAADGSILERGFWRFEVRKGSLFRESEFQANTSLNLSYRSGEKNLPEDTRRDSANAAASIQGAVSGDGWRVSGNTEMIYNSNDSNQAGEENFEPAYFLLNADAGLLNARLGHHAPMSDSFVVQGFNRRGVSASIYSENKANSLSVFRVRTDNISGLRDGLGIGKADKRTEGVTVTARPLAAHQEALVISATYLASEGSSFGEGEGGEEFETAGQASSLVLDSQLFERRLRLRGELAKTQYDFDGRNVGYAAEQDQAHSMLAVFTPRETIIDEHPMLVRFGLEHKRIGSFFRSEANPYLLADRESIRGFTSLSWVGLDVQLSSGSEQDNVNNLLGLGRTQTDRNAISFAYSPLPTVDPQTGDVITPWYGQAVYSVSFNQASQDVIEAGEGLVIGPLHDNEVYALSASFSYDSWDWSLTRSWSKDADYSDVELDTENYQTDIAFNYRVGERLSLGTNLQRGYLLDVDNNLATKNDLYGLNLSWLVNEHWLFNLMYSVSSDRAEGDTDKFIEPAYTATTDITTNLTWTVRQAKSNYAGVQLSLDGAYNKFEDKYYPEFTQESYQVFLKLMVNWAPGY